MKRTAMLHRGAMVVMCVGMLGLITAGCYDMPEHAPMLNAADFRPGLSLEPNPIRFTPIVGAFPCTGGGFAVETPFHLFVSAGVHDLTLDSVTIHMIDGSNLGGPSITIPQSDFAAQSASLFIVAGTTRDFVVRPDFGCVTTRPRSLRGNVFLLDPSGMMQTIAFDGTVQ